MAGGRPPKYKEVKELGEKIDRYFMSITIDEPRTHQQYDGEGVDDKGEKYAKFKTVPTLNNLGEQIVDINYTAIPSILGLCEYLGIVRNTLLEYESAKEFTDTIKKAKLRIEKYNSEQLYRKDQVTGIIFNLKNNFDWKDKTEIDQKTEHSGELKIIKPTFE